MSPVQPKSTGAAASRHARHRILFLSTMNGVPWGGSEELWSEAALRLRADGHEVHAGVLRWPAVPEPVRRLAAAGVRVAFLPRKRGPVGRILHQLGRRLATSPVDLPLRNWLRGLAPTLVVVSQGGPWDGVPWMRACAQAGIPYSTVVHANSEQWWPLDEHLAHNREAYGGARAVFFVSEANRRLMERQCGMDLPRGGVVINPCKVRRSQAAIVPWPDESVFKLACVGRLAPNAKGQDLLLAALALPKWRQRPVRLRLYGTGPAEGSLRAFAQWQALSNIEFRGHVADLHEIWADNHALVLPSRFEGLPIAIVEAMLCGRPVITTDVAGNAEVVRDEGNGFVASAPSLPCLDEALERAWSRRHEWRALGVQAFSDARARLPEDPVGVFAGRIAELCEEPSGPARRLRFVPESEKGEAALARSSGMAAPTTGGAGA